jgi:hypothetical protein
MSPKKSEARDLFAGLINHSCGCKILAHLIIHGLHRRGTQLPPDAAFASVAQGKTHRPVAVLGTVLT